MAFKDMIFRLTGDVPGLPGRTARTHIIEAMQRIYDEQMWSWQLKEGGWLTPGIIGGTVLPYQSLGTITATAYSTSIVGDATAAALWQAYVAAGKLPLITQFQIRCAPYSLYNIIAFNGTNTFTLDRPWMEPDGAGLTYMMYQAYFAAPVLDFKRFFSIWDPTNSAPLDYWSYDRRRLAVEDPQREIFDEPAYVVPYEIDNRAGSATLGYMLFELWPHPLSILPYSFAYLRSGPLPSAMTDTVPPPLTEEAVMWRAREVSYLWKEAHKGEDMKRGSGADWRFLAQAASKEYQDAIKNVKDRDRDLVDLYFNKYRRYMTIQDSGEPFATITGGLNVGRM